MKKIYVAGIDWQRDFCDDTSSHTPALAVPGGQKAAENFAEMIRDNAMRINDIFMTLDMHPWLHVAHNEMWIDEKGHVIPPITASGKVLSLDDIRTGKARTRAPGLINKFRDYVEKAGGVIPLWPPHCLIGEAGSNLIPVINDAVRYWEKATVGKVNFISKGSNPFTDQFGGLEAVVPDPADETTMLNMNVIKMIDEADVVIWGGLALDYCLKTTMEQILANLPPEFSKKCWLLTDGTSSIFPDAGQKFIDDMRSNGMNISTCGKVFSLI